VQIISALTDIDGVSIARASATAGPAEIRDMPR
jgi:hypothetical protein